MGRPAPDRGDDLRRARCRLRGLAGRAYRVFAQGRRFDPHGDYVRRWVPELAHLPGAAAHEPWKHPDGYVAGYPEPILDHALERAESLRRFRGD